MKKILPILITAVLPAGFSFGQYCGNGPSSTFDSSVEQVVLNGASGTNINWLGCPATTGLNNQTALSVDLELGANYSVDVTFGTCNGNYSGAGSVWIDWNNNQVFEPSELVGGSSGTPGTAPWNAPVTFNITVPGSAIAGPTRMRVMQQENGTLPLDPCAGFTWGSKTDFTINVVIPSCVVPVDVTLIGGTQTSAELDWNQSAYSITNDYIVEYGVSGFTPGTFPNVMDVNGATDASITGLTPGTSYDYYVYSNCGPDTSSAVGPLTQVTECSPVINETLITAGSTTAQIDWLSSGTDFIIEYGFNGFTPGGFVNTTTVSGGANTVTLTGLTPDSQYEAYVYNDCGLDSSVAVGPISFNTYDLGIYIEADDNCGPGFFDISSTGTQDVLGGDGEVGKTLPFVFVYQGIVSDEITIANDGAIEFGTLTANTTWNNEPLATAGLTGFFPFWNDNSTPTAADGIFTETIGTAPNRQYIIQFNVPLAFNGAPNIYQVVLDEATQEIYFLYEVTATGSFGDNGSSATIGVGGPQNIELSYNSTTYLENNSCAHFYYTDCPKVENLAVQGYYTDTIIVSWSPGLAGETDWTIEYGPAGFTPGTGTTFSTTNTQDTIGGLTQLTDYDVYVYADCNPSLQSFGNMISTQTAPICTTPTGVTATAMEDSIGANWSWVPTTVPVTGFNIQYGLSGAGQYGNNTTVAVDNNFNDTVVDNTLLGGTLYDVYVQAVCGADTSLYAGPFTIITPLTNDTTCSAIPLNIDGTVYNFNNTGATVGAGETNIAPPNTGFNETDGWNNSTLNNTTWFTFVAPASGRVYITGQDQGFAGQMAVYSVTDCGDYNTFTLEGANDNAINGGGAAPGWVQCGLTAGNTYYLMHDGNSNTTGNYSIRLEDVDLNAGSFDTPLEACSGDTVDLFTAISGQDAGGVWIDYANTFQLSGSNFATTVLATGVVYDFEYRVTRECAYDSVIATVEIYGPSQAGDDGTMTVCQNQPINLFSALNGGVDLGGTWYDPTDSALPNATPTASNIPGQFNYDYIVGNGVCPDDTSLVVITVDPSCDYLGLEDAQLEGISIFPNPTSDILTVASNGSHEALNVEVVDVNGRVVYTSNESVLVGSTLNIDVTSFETGVYILRLFNNEVENTYRVVVK